METKQHDIFISYKTIPSMSTASLLYTRLKMLGYSAFINIEDMPPGEWEKYIYQCIDTAKDIIVVIEKGSLEGWCLYDEKGEKTNKYKEDYFYKEVAYAFKQNKNIVPIWRDYNISDCQESSFPPEISKLKKLQSPAFSLLHMDSSMDNITSKGFLKSKSQIPHKGGSIFKLYSNENCNVYNGKNIIGKVEANADEPFYWHIERKGDYRLRCVAENGKSPTLNCTIDTNEEKIVDIKFSKKKLPKHFVFYGLGLISACILFYILLNIGYTYNIEPVNDRNSLMEISQPAFPKVKTWQNRMENKLEDLVQKDINSEKAN